MWPEELQHTFQTLLSKGVLATVESFDGSANVLSLCLDTKSDRRQLTAIMLDALQDQAKAYVSSFSQAQEQTGSGAEVISHSPQATSMSVTKMGAEEAASSTESVAWTPQLAKTTPTPSMPGW